MKRGDNVGLKEQGRGHPENIEKKEGMLTHRSTHLARFHQFPLWLFVLPQLLPA